METHRGIPGQLQIQTRKQDGAVVVELIGELDSHESLRLRPVLLGLVERKVVVILINLGGLAFIDSAGIATLIECLQGIRGYGGRLRLYGMNQLIRNVFEVARLDTVFQIFGTEDDALAS